MAPVSRLAAIALVCVGGVAACHSPADDYQHFVDETADLRNGSPPVYGSQFADISGRWFVNASLAGSLSVGLRMSFTLAQTTPPTQLDANIWLDTANLDTDPPLITTHATIDTTGRFTLLAEPLVLAKGSVKGLNVDVSANVVMDNYTQSADEWCGDATGSVVQPFALDLSGSTLGALRDDAGTKTLADVPTHCPAPDMK